MNDRRALKRAADATSSVAAKTADDDDLPKDIDPIPLIMVHFPLGATEIVPIIHNYAFGAFFLSKLLPARIESSYALGIPHSANVRTV